LRGINEKYSVRTDNYPACAAWNGGLKRSLKLVGSVSTDVQQAKAK
jgi:hypothetical protein